MSTAKYFVGDIGSVMSVDSGYANLSTEFTNPQLVVLKPDYRTEAWQAEFAEGSKISYTVKNGDFDVAGVYRVQLRVHRGAHRFHGEIEYVRIEQPVPVYGWVRGITSGLRWKCHRGVVNGAV